MAFSSRGRGSASPLKDFSRRSAWLSGQAPARAPTVEALWRREPTTCNGPFFQQTGACNGKRFRPFSSSGVLVQTEALPPANPNKTKRSFLVRPKRFAPREPFPPKRLGFYRKRFALETPINRSALLFSQTEALQSAGLKLAGALRSRKGNGWRRSASPAVHHWSVLPPKASQLDGFLFAGLGGERFGPGTGRNRSASF